MWPANLSLLCRNISDRLPRSTLRRTSSLEMWSRHNIPRIVRKHLSWKTSSFCRMLNVLFQVSQAWSTVGMTMDMYSRSLVSRLMEWLDHIFRRRWKVDAALPILARISTSTSDSVEMMLPRYWNSLTPSNVCWPIVVGVAVVAPTVDTLDFSQLIRNPTFSAVVFRLSVICCSVVAECLRSATSSAKSRSVNFPWPQEIPNSG